MNFNALMACGFILVSSLFLLAGCDLAPCQDVQRNYEREVRSEQSFVELSDQGAPHLAMALRLDLLNDLTQGLLNSTVGQALATRGSLNVAGQSVSYGVSSTRANLRFDASGACATCLRIQGDIDGSVEAVLPAVGRQTSPLSGSIDWTVPLAVGREDDGKVAVFIDSAQAVRMGTPRVEGALSALPGNWASQLLSPLVAELSKAVAENVPPIRLFGYEMPRLGLRGLEMTPSLFAFDSRSNALVLGVRTNLPVDSRDASQQDLLQALALSEGQNIALGIQPGAVLESVRLGMQQGRVARQYSLTGDANRNGPVHVVTDRFAVGAHRQVQDAVELGLAFRLFNFGSGLGCFTNRGSATSRLQINNGRIELELENVNFTGNALAEVANWGSAQFIQQTQTVVAHTLNDDIVFSPDVGMSLRGDQVSTAAGMLVLRGRGSAN